MAEKISMKDYELDNWGVPTAFPDDLDTSLWPKEIPLQPTHDRTKQTLWVRTRAMYDEYIACLDELIEHCVNTETEFSMTYWRRVFHRVLGLHYGYNFPFYKQPKRECDDRQEEKPVAADDPEHIRLLTEAAQAVDKQPDSTDSLNWAFEKLALVMNMGWDTIQPEDVIGVGALGLLQRGVEDPKWFYEKIAARSFKKNETGQTGFEDDGTEQIEYAEKLAQRAKERVG